MVRHAFIIGFTILLLFFLYQEGESLADGFRRVLRQRIGERADGYVDLATRAVRASVNSMLVVALFDGFATGIAVCDRRRAARRPVGRDHRLARARPVPRICGRRRVDVAARDDGRSRAGASRVRRWAAFVLLCGDKIVRPVVARDGIRLPFVWVLMGCLGGFEVLGLIGLVIGPVVLTLARELWEQRVRDVAASDLAGCFSASPDSSQTVV